MTGSDRSRPLARAISCADAIVATLTGIDTIVEYHLEPSATFTPILSGQPARAGEGRCRYRLRYGNVGDMAFAQLRLYAGACIGYRVHVCAWQGNTYGTFSSEATAITSTDRFGPYLQLQATSDADWIATRAVVESGRRSPQKIHYYFNSAVQGGGAPIDPLIVRHRDET